MILKEHATYHYQHYPCLVSKFMIIFYRGHINFCVRIAATVKFLQKSLCYYPRNTKISKESYMNLLILSSNYSEKVGVN